MSKIELQLFLLLTYSMAAQANQRVPLQRWRPDFVHTDRERWVVVYPAYINSKRTVAEGRKIPKDKGVDNPTYAEIRDVLNNVGCKCEVENKVYCKERDPKDLKFRGRIRVQLKDENGIPLMEQFPTRRSVFLYLGETIPKLKGRQAGSGGTSQQHQASGGGGKKKRDRKK